MKQKFLLLAALAGGGILGAQAQQLTNSTFDNAWVNCYPYVAGKHVTRAQGTQPDGWTISNVDGMGGTGATVVGSEDNSHTGHGKAVNLVNKANQYMKSQKVPAYLTLGTTWSTSYVKFIKPTNNDGGTFGGINFTNKPDAITFDYKTNSSQAQKPMVIAYLWSGSWSQANVPTEIKMGKPATETMVDRDRNILGMSTDQGGAVTNNNGVKIASMQQEITAKTNDWETATFDFTYDKPNATPEKLNIIFSAGNYFADATQVVEGLTVSIDNVKLVYYHELLSVRYNGLSYAVGANNEVDLSSVAYDSSITPEFTKKGVGATIQTTFDENTQTMKVEVFGNDFAANPASKTVYTLRFKSDAQVAAPELASLSISGVPFTELKAGQTEYTLPFAYNPGLVFQGKANGTATVSESIYDNVAKTHTVNVVDAASNKTTKYVFSFTEAVADAASGIYDGALSVVLTNAENVSVPTALNNASINVTKNANGTINLAINNFSFGGIPVGDIFVSNVPMNADKIEKTRRTILMTAFNEDGTPNTDCLGWMMGALPVEVSAELNTTAKNTLASIDIITADNPMLSQMFKGIHVDFVPFTVKGNLLDDSFSGRQYYENLTVSGHVTKAASKFLQINNHFFDPNNNNQECNLPMSFLDLSKAIVDANVTMDDIMAGAPKANNTLVYLPAGSTIQAANAIVDSKATNFVVNDQVAFHAPKAFTATQVSYDRAFKFGNGYVSSFVLPFAMNTTYVDGKVYKFNAVNGDNVNFTEVTGQLKANVPYLIVANSAKPFSTALAKEVEIEATPETMEVKADNAPSFAHIGSYNTTKVTSENGTTYYGYTGGKFVKANYGTLNPFRTLIKATGTTATQFSLKLDGEVTGIIGVNTELGKVDVYNLEGKLVRSQVEAATALQGLEKGVYVINGKKVMK